MLHTGRFLQQDFRRSLHTLKQLLDEKPAAGTATRIQGWVLSMQHLKRKSFAMISDGSTHERIQAVLSPEQAAALRYRTSVCIDGKLALPRRPETAPQRYDLEVEHVAILGDSQKDIPLQNKYNTAEHLRHYAHLRPQTQGSGSILRLQSRVLQAISAYLTSQDYCQTLPPILTSSDCEGAGETFLLQQGKAFFGKPTRLAVSSQLHLECLAMGLSRVWSLSPTFRAEKSTTARHLAEFRMLEAELSFATLTDLLDSVEGVVRAAARAVMHHKDELDFLHTREADHVDGAQAGASALCAPLASEPWPRIRYTEAISILTAAVEDGRAAFFFQISPGCSLRTEHEQFLAKHFCGPLFVTHYPASQKPFYMLPSPEDDGETVACFDLLVPGMGELCGGSMRQDAHAPLIEAMTRAGVSEEEMAWYADLRKYGSVPHGGYGIGFERLIAYLIGVTNVREVAAFPRWSNHCVA